MSYYKNQKQILLALLKLKGSCDKDQRIDCNKCPIEKTEPRGCYDDVNVYEKTKNLYIKRYGEIELIEVLL